MSTPTRAAASTPSGMNSQKKLGLMPPAKAAAVLPLTSANCGLPNTPQRYAPTAKKAM